MFDLLIKNGFVIDGSGQNRTGKSGNDLILKVPLGTQVFEEDNKTLIYDFIKTGEEFIAAAGGKGGLGNTRFKSSTNRAPRKFTKGTVGGAQLRNRLSTATNTDDLKELLLQKVTV